MPKYMIAFTVECDNEDQAFEVAASRLGYDEDLGFDYLITQIRSPILLKESRPLFDKDS